MVKLFCALVGAARSAFPVDIDASQSVGDLKEAIKKKKQRTITCDADELDLYLAKKGDTWLPDDDPAALQLEEGGIHEDIQAIIDGEKMKATKTLQHWLFDKSKMPLPSTDQIHVLVVVPTEVEQPAHKKAKTSTVIKDEDMKSIAQNLDIDTWQLGGISLDICHVESDFPEWFYVRKETLDIIKVFKNKMEAKLHIVFVGTPGVGKTMLVVLFAFYMALHQKKRVVLFRKKKGEGFSMLYMDGENEQYWRMDRAKISALDLVVSQDFELCLDGLIHQDIADNFASLARFRLLATSVQYPVKNDDTPVLRRCLVPFWSSLDLNAIGAHRQWSKHEIKERYFYSGGNLRDFLSEKIVVMDSIDQAVGLVDLPVAELLNTQYAVGSVRQIDRLRMTGIRANNQSALDKYMTSRSWCCVITSEYVLRQLGRIVKASYYEVLWSKGRMLGDDGLMGIAFENYVHTMARDGKKIELQVRAYDRAKVRQHTYVALEFEAKSCRSDGMDAAECDAVMKQLSSSSDDYWYPSSRSLVTIDSVAKLNMGGQHNVVGLIQITKSDHHKIDSKALDKYAGFFPNGSRYIALVPDKETCDEFRLSPADPPTEVPLDVAYITTWSL